MPKAPNDWPALPLKWRRGVPPGGAAAGGTAARGPGGGMSVGNDIRPPDPPARLDDGPSLPQDRCVQWFRLRSVVAWLQALAWPQPRGVHVGHDGVQVQRLRPRVLPGDVRLQQIHATDDL